jgi:hypothetical protein
VRLIRRLILIRQWLTSGSSSGVNGGTKNAPLDDSNVPEIGAVSEGKLYYELPRGASLGMVTESGDAPLYEKSMGCHVSHRAVRECKVGETLLTVPRTAMILPNAGCRGWPVFGPSKLCLAGTRPLSPSCTPSTAGVLFRSLRRDNQVRDLWPFAVMRVQFCWFQQARRSRGAHSCGGLMRRFSCHHNSGQHKTNGELARQVPQLTLSTEERGSDGHVVRLSRKPSVVTQARPQGQIRWTSLITRHRLRYNTQRPFVHTGAACC